MPGSALIPSQSLGIVALDAPSPLVKVADFLFGVTWEILVRRLAVPIEGLFVITLHREAGFVNIAARLYSASA